MKDEWRGWIEIPVLPFTSDLIIIAALYRSLVLSLTSSGIDFSLSGKEVPGILTSASLDLLNAALIMPCIEMELE